MKITVPTMIKLLSSYAKIRQKSENEPKRSKRQHLPRKPKKQAVYAGKSFETMEEPSDDEEDVMEEEEGFILDK